MIESVIFDLDGTLVNSLPGIEASAKFALGKCLPKIELPPLQPVIGPPIAKMFAKLFPDLDPERMQTLLAAFREHYGSEGCLLSQLYPGVSATLKTLRQRGLRLFVLTNKPLAPTISILKHTGVHELFEGAVSPDSASPPFTSKPDGARFLQKKFAFESDATLLVGDGPDDARAAAECGFRFVAARYGYGQVEETSAFAAIEKFSEIENILF